MLGFLEDAGFSFTDDEYEADVIVINTCCFIDDAKTESIETILDMAAMKTEGNCRKLVVAGCLSQRYQEELLTEFPEVDAYIGTGDLSAIVDACRLPAASAASDTPYNFVVQTNSDHKFLWSKQVQTTKLCGPEEKTNIETTKTETAAARRVITTPGHYEFLKIAEGCNKYCTYCIIPYIRGKYSSYPMEDLLKEANDLAANGVKELILVAQETSIYGKDLYGREALPDLLKELCKIDGLAWIRLLYCYPEDITEEFLQVMASEPKICHYIDMPIQHASDRILKKMGRRTDRASILQTIGRIRELMPDVTLRTSLITGFPSETEEDHRILKDFIKEVRFDHLGVFPYSQEEGTPAASMPEQIDEAVKVQRRDELMQLQEGIAAQKMAAKVGMDLPVLIEGYLPEDDIYVGRTQMDAPEVDGFFYVKADVPLDTGDLIFARVMQANAYDLYGEMINENESAE